MDQITIIKPDDMHVHFRDGAMLRAVVPETSKHFARALVMPNVPEIRYGPEAYEYQRRIEAVAGPGFIPLMTCKLTPETRPDDILVARQFGVKAAKLYPSGVTTASHNGITDVEALAPVLEEMQACGLVLCIHGEDPEAFVLDREFAYLSKVRWVVRNFPGLKVVLEHITTEAAVRFVQESSVNVAATITPHHLWETLDAVLGRGGLRPHSFCYPVPKTPRDLWSLRSAAIYQDGGRFLFGSDSAPHLRSAKESACGCAGVFNAPTALATLAEVFLGDPETHSGAGYQARLRALEDFTSRRGAEFYGLPPNEGTVTLVRESWTVPAEIAGVVPFRAGETLSWRVRD